MRNWLRELLAPAPVLAGVGTGGQTPPTVWAFSEEGGGEQQQAPAEPAPAAAPAPTDTGPPAAAGEIMGRPMMHFILDMAAGGGALLLLVAFFTPWAPGFLGFRYVLGWQGFLFSLLLIFLVASTITFMKKRNWGLVYLALGGYQLLFLVIHLICGGGVHVAWVLSLIGTLLLGLAGIMQWLVCKCPGIEKCWPVGMQVKLPGA
jgi:hypothetical protein